MIITLETPSKLLHKQTKKQNINKNKQKGNLSKCELEFWQFFDRMIKPHPDLSTFPFPKFGPDTNFQLSRFHQIFSFKNHRTRVRIELTT